uniref:Venom S1 protease with CUB domain 1 n=1 Tax=Platymeris rhadamanthus TaxID=1134088 RepID=A0A6B9L1M6_PLARH|nr:venom S1 protease with CUB domain 1 [Platymeris rhadamanthus]
MLKYILVAVLLTAIPAFAEVDHEIKLEQGKVYSDLKTPDYPNTFTATKPIIWKFESEADTRIVIKCIDFRLSETVDCQSIKLEVDVGDNTQNYCGHYDALKVISSSNVLTLKLEGDEYGQGLFSCYVKSTKAPEPEELEVKLNNVLKIGSPVSLENDPVPYYDKVWHLKTDEGYQIGLDCYINLLEIEPCHDDVMTIDLGDGEQEYCGYKKELIFSKGNEATVRLELDKDGTGKVLCLAQAVIKKDEIDEIDIQDVKQETRALAVDSSEHGGPAGKRKTTCPCGWANKPRARIIRGNEASPNEYPWMVGLRSHFGNVYAACGGSIVTHRHVITAAHCLLNMNDGLKPVKPIDLFVIVGAHDLRKFLPKKYYREYRAERHFIRPEFPKWLTHDFAIIVVKESIQFSNVVGPICLSPTSIEQANKVITIMGWGKTERSSGSAVLLKAKTEVKDRKWCRINKWEICTRADKSATCSGDSGGPLVLLDEETNRYFQMSLVSYGHVDCVSSPSVSTDVSFFYPWLLEKIKETYPKELTCVKA